MRQFTQILLLTNISGGWLIFLTGWEIFLEELTNAYVGLVVLIPTIIMINVVNYVFNNYREPQTRLTDFERVR